jgi:hypothetical protein
VTDALQFLSAYRHRNDSLVVMNPRRLGVILDKQAHRGTVIPVEAIAQSIHGPMKERLQAWLADPPTPYYVVHVTGSWLLKCGGKVDPR